MSGREKLCFVLLFLSMSFFCSAYLMANSTSLVITNLPQSNKHFTGREEILKKIKVSFDEGHFPVVVSGFLGTGKTRTARQFAEVNKADYDIIWFIDAKESLSDQYKLLAAQLNDSNWLEKGYKININAQPTVLLEKINNFLQTTQKNWLIIFDNVQSKEEIFELLPARNSFSRGHILITTRNETEWVHPIKLGKLKREESIALFKKVTHLEDRSQLDRLSLFLFDHPLSIIQAACYIRKHSLENVDIYIQLFKDRRKDLWKREDLLLKKDKDVEDIHDNYQMTAETAFRLSLDEMKTQSSLALDLLYISSFWHNNKIPEDLLSDFAKEQGYDPIFDYNDAISELIKESFFEKEKIGGVENTFSMHDLTVLVLLEMQGEEEKRNNIRKSVELFTKFLAGGWDRITQILSKRPHLLAHIETLCRHAEAHKFYESSLIELKLYLLEYHMYHTRDQVTYENLMQDITRLINEVKNISPLTLARFYINRVYSRSIFEGKDENIAEKIEQDYEKAIQIFCQDAAQNEELFRAYLNFAQHYLLHGEYKKSVEIIKKAENLLKGIKSASYRNLFFFVKAMILCEGEDYSAANQAINQAIDRVEKEENIALQIYIKNMKAWTDLRLGNLESAYQWAKNTQKKALEFYDDKNNDVIPWVLIIKAIYKENKGDLEGAEKEIQESLKRLSYIYEGPVETEDQAYGHIVLGNIYMKKGQLLEAQNAYEIAEKIYNRIYRTIEGYGPCELYVSFAILGAKLKDDFLAKHYLDLHTKYFGADHQGEKEILRAFEENSLEILW